MLYVAYMLSQLQELQEQERCKHRSDYMLCRLWSLLRHFVICNMGLLKIKLTLNKTDIALWWNLHHNENACMLYVVCPLYISSCHYPIKAKCWHMTHATDVLRVTPMRLVLQNILMSCRTSSFAPYFFKFWSSFTLSVTIFFMFLH